MKRLIIGPAITAAVLASACTHSVDTPPPAPVIAASPPVEEAETVAVPVEDELSPRERIQRAVQLLDAGKETEALADLEILIADNPQHATARKLLDQIQLDPEDLLGTDHTEHTVQPGETISTLSKTFLGDPLLFYALSRYNGLEAPNRLMAGQTLKMPVTSKAEAKAAPEPEQVVQAPADEVQAPDLPTARQVASPADIAAAKALRLQALQELNGGDSERAMTLLQRAKALDSDNQNIASDLAKVERIQATLNMAE